MKEIKLFNIIQLDATYEQINFKGTRPDKMPRKSKKRGKQNSILYNEWM